MDPFLTDAIPLDTDLVSNYPELVKLADYLFAEVAAVARATNPYRSKEALKLILINLYKGYRRGRAIRYSRDKRYYSCGRRYHEIWFKYDRIIPIIDALKKLGYAEYKDGLHYPDDDVLYQSRIWASQKLLALFHEFHFQKIIHIKEKPPLELIQLRSSKKDGGHKIKYKDDHKTETMRANLIRYNKFIQKQNIEVRLPPDAKVSWHFLEARKGNILSNRIEITRFSTKNDWFLVVDGEDFHGFEIDGMRFIIATDELPENVNKYILDHQITISNYNTYYSIFINKILQTIHTDSPNSKPNNKPKYKITTTHTTTPTPTISMTQSFYQYLPENQLLTLPNSTTVGGNEDRLEKRPFSIYGIYELEFRSKYQLLHRVFTQFLDQGGRFYGAVHLDLPKECRPFIFINDQPTIELDYGAQHVRMLYHWKQTQYDKDPYEELCRTPEERPIYKKVLLVGINAKSEKEAIPAISNELYEDGFRGECLTHKYIKECLDRFKDLHKPIAEYLFNAKWWFLQFDDSQIMEEVLMRMVSKKIPALPVHDSVIAPVEHEEALRQVMVEAYQKVIGRDFLPIIKKS